MGLLILHAHEVEMGEGKVGLGKQKQHADMLEEHVIYFWTI